MIRAWTISVVFLVLVGCTLDATTTPDAGTGGGDVDAAGFPQGDGGGEPAECAEGVPGCTCTEVPQGSSCVHSFGGTYSDKACSGSYQCCNGNWQEGLNVCGDCACSEPTGEQGCQGSEVECFPAFQGTSEPVPDAVREAMIGVSWHEGIGCPDIDSLRLLTLDHWGFDGQVHQGQLIVAEGIADDMLAVFRALYDAGFAIERMEPVDVYGGDDDASMAANNTSAFNCRQVTGGTTLSAHASGAALDINPVQNPYVRSSTVLPPAGESYVDRTHVRQGMITAGGPVVQAFASVGWAWGGDFSSLKDYQHFSLSGR